MSSWSARAGAMAAVRCPRRRRLPLPLAQAHDPDTCEDAVAGSAVSGAVACVLRHQGMSSGFAVKWKCAADARVVAANSAEVHRHTYTWRGRAAGIVSTCAQRMQD